MVEEQAGTVHCDTGQGKPTGRGQPDTPGAAEAGRCYVGRRVSVDLHWLPALWTVDLTNCVMGVSLLYADAI